MMDVLLNHVSIRKFSSDAIDEGLIARILEAATRASTTGNMQVYSIVRTSDPIIRKDLWESHFKQNMVMEAPLHLTFCADFNRFSKWCSQRNADPGYDNYLSFLTAATDALLAAQNACIAAESEGLGICYLGTVTWMARRFIEILKLPKLVVPVAAVVMGHPAETPPLTDRLPLQGMVHHEVYQDYSEADIDRIYAEKEALESTRDILIENKMESLARVFTEKRYTRNDNRLFSKAFLDVLAQQGFMNQ